MLKDDVIISDNSVISEDYITELLKNVTKSNEGASIEKVLNLFKNQNAVRYFKYNVNQYCDLHRLAISEIQDSINTDKIMKK
ncbi:hypothetical protein BDFB_000323 [Asbolus verrucosus]|uniref:Uncharacterized protein n=1 Tax=Asbolus verrucosus TaxID=1661398 RepID=A0A482WB52_ASBVE|nr:hypothetical protein BDFB_000323 [Asbolus verrucosus]